jgi:hypothetical protein
MDFHLLHTETVELILVKACNEFCYLIFGAAKIPMALLQGCCVMTFGILQVCRNWKNTQPKKGGTNSHIVVKSEHTQAE